MNQTCSSYEFCVDIDSCGAKLVLKFIDQVQPNRTGVYWWIDGSWGTTSWRDVLSKVSENTIRWIRIIFGSELYELKTILRRHMHAPRPNQVWDMVKTVLQRCKYCSRSVRRISLLRPSSVNFKKLIGRGYLPACLPARCCTDVTGWPGAPLEMPPSLSSCVAPCGLLYKLNLRLLPRAMFEYITEIIHA